jgi:thrombospondin type 3 repeat protein
MVGRGKMKKIALLLIVFFGVSGLTHASVITFSESIQSGITVGTRTYDYLVTTDGKYRAVAYHYKIEDNQGSWQPGDFVILNGTFDTPSLYTHWLWWEWKEYQGFYIEKIDGGLFDLVSMDIVADLATAGTGGVAVTAGITPGAAFLTADWQSYTVSGLNNVVPPGPLKITINFGNAFTGVDRVYLDGGYPFFSNTPADYTKGALWDNIVLSESVIVDSDGDGIPDASDNCPDAGNPDQADNDGDGEGDVCDSDDDNDSVLDTSDNCPLISNLDQANNDSDGFGDACDADDDNDGVSDLDDNCQYIANADQADTDGDGQGDVCDGDDDGDGILDTVDNCTSDPNPLQEDNDLDGFGDACDADDDNDGVLDLDDNCTTVENPDQNDLDSDSIGDACDADLDGDGVNNDIDNCPVTANAGQDDTDFDGAGDACDEDDDNDSILDVNDNCSLIYNPSQEDADGDGRGDICDADLDGDGVDNDYDNCPVVANSSQNDFDGDGLGDACDPDIDDDGVANASDLCANTPLYEIVDPATGCSIIQLCPCEGPRGTSVFWKNHGKYVSCVAKSSESFVEMGLITEEDKDILVSTAAESSCGDKK